MINMILAATYFTLYKNHFKQISASLPWTVENDIQLHLQCTKKVQYFLFEFKLKVKGMFLFTVI